MPHIPTLFNLYRAHCAKHPDLDALFEQSKMENRYHELELGFFPMGTGILNYTEGAHLEQLDQCDLFVLGNDFGNTDYVSKLKDRREKKTNPTIRNLISEQGLGLDPSTTFFTNFFMGLRTSDGQTGLKSSVQLAYKQFCLDFLSIQLEYIQPKLVIILGKEVVQTLGDLLVLNPEQHQPILVHTGVFSGVHVMAIPHPSMAHFNWKGGLKEEMKSAMSKLMVT
jgi:hypothetical protein